MKNCIPCPCTPLCWVMSVTSNCKVIRRFSVKNRRFSGAILPFFVLFHQKVFKTVGVSIYRTALPLVGSYQIQNHRFYRFQHKNTL